MLDHEKELALLDQEYIEAGRDGLERPFARPLEGHQKDVADQLYHFLFEEPLAGETIPD